MRFFNDKAGGKWEIRLTIGDVFRVKKASDGRFDLFEPAKPVDGKPLGELLDADDGAFWELLCHLLEPQLLEKKLVVVEPVLDGETKIAEVTRPNFEAFGILLAADCWPVARKQFFEAWVDFFQSLQRPDKALPLEKLAKYQAKALELMKAKIAEDPRLRDLDAKVEAKMRSTLSKSFGASLDSLESQILGPAPGESSTTSEKAPASRSSARRK